MEASPGRAFQQPCFARKGEEKKKKKSDENLHLNLDSRRGKRVLKKRGGKMNIRLPGPAAPDADGGEKRKEGKKRKKKEKITDELYFSKRGGEWEGRGKRRGNLTYFVLDREKGG